MFISVLTPSIRPEFLDITQECLEQQTFTDFEWLVDVGLRNKGFQLPADLNKLLKRAKGERVVMLQDCICIEPDTLGRIDKLSNDFWTFPVGQVMNFKEEPAWDWRKHKDGKITPNLWEADFASAPLKAFYDIGGYDEAFCDGWSWENVEVAWRAAAAGYEFYSEPTITGVALSHDKIKENPFRNKKPNNDWRAEETRHKASRGNYRLDYM